MHFLKIYTFSIVILAACVCSLSADDIKQVGSWKSMPLPGTLQPGYDRKVVYGLSVDKDGTLWVIVDSGVYYWDGSSYHTPTVDQVAFNRGVSYLVGGNDRDLYLIRYATDRLHSRIYLLEKGQGKYITDCYMPESQRFCSVYVSKNGRLCNWGGKFLSVYANGDWKRIETNLGLGNTSILDTGDNIYFYYNGTLCTIDRYNKMTSINVEIPSGIQNDRYTESCALWGKGSALIARSSAPYATVINLETGDTKPAPDKISEFLFDAQAVALRSLPNGNLLFYGISKDHKPVINIITPEGQIQSIQDLAPKYQSNLFNSPKDQFLVNADSSLWFTAPGSGIMHVVDNHAQLYDYHSGAPMNMVKSIKSGRDNNIYALLEDAIFMYDPNGTTAPDTEINKTWQEYYVNRPDPVRSSDGSIWCFLIDHPKEISCWDGKKWNHIPFFNDTVYMSIIAIDDRGHILLSQASGNRDCYVVSLDGIRKYNKFEDALVELVADGSKQFETYAAYKGCVVDKSGRIMFSDHYRNYIKIWDKKNWGIMSELSGYNYIQENGQHDFLICPHATEGTFYKYDNGQFTALDDNLKDMTKALLGSYVIQPYDEALYKEKPGQYLVVEKNSKGIWAITTGEPSKPDQTTTYPIYSSISAKGYDGGFWLGEYEKNRLIYTMNGLAFPCDLSNLPQNGRRTGQIYEDSEYNLWVFKDYYAGYLHLFMRAKPSAEITIVNPPKTASHSVKLDILTNNVPEKSYLFWRVDKGLWTPGDKDALRVIFPRDGKHTVQVKAIDEIGGTVAISAPVQIESKAGLPKTALIGKGPFQTDEPYWKLPVSGTPSSKGALIRFNYQIDNSEWKTTTVAGEVVLVGLNKGIHKIKAVAVEDDTLTDPKPVSFDFTYSPDIQKTAEKLISLLSSKDQKFREQATRCLMEAGPDIIAEVSKQNSIGEVLVVDYYNLNQDINEMSPKNQASSDSPELQQTAHRLLLMFGDRDQKVKKQAMAELKQLGPVVIPEL